MDDKQAQVTQDVTNALRKAAQAALRLMELNRMWPGVTTELRAAFAEPLRRGSTGVCSRNICEREGLGDQCVWLRSVDEPHIDGYPLMSGLPPPAQAAQAEPVAWTDVLAERRRQVTSEGWTARHDDKHDDGSIALAAACYAINAATWAAKGTADLRQNYADLSPGARWPWPRKWWKPKSQRQDLVRAGALILAEIERLDRKEKANG